jgi:tetratricopeptide (TPR) repeat protein
MKRVALISLIFSASLGCSSLKTFFAVEEKSQRNTPIINPFDNYSPSASHKENIVLRTKKGDRSVEVELPGGTADMTDFVMPVSPAFKDAPTRSPAGGAMDVDETYKDRTPSISDREITGNLPQVNGENDVDRREIETGLGVIPSEDSVPSSDKSYLASIDLIKQLYKHARFEAALLEVDGLLRSYPTDARLYEMRGTLLERVGRTELALKSWNQALQLNPRNESLRRFIERKSAKRGLAGQ